LTLLRLPPPLVLLILPLGDEFEKVVGEPVEVANTDEKELGDSVESKEGGVVGDGNTGILVPFSVLGRFNLSGRSLMGTSFLSGDLDVFDFDFPFPFPAPFGDFAFFAPFLLRQREPDPPFLLPFLLLLPLPLLLPFPLDLLLAFLLMPLPLLFPFPLQSIDGAIDTVGSSLVTVGSLAMMGVGLVVEEGRPSEIVGWELIVGWWLIDGARLIVGWCEIEGDDEGGFENSGQTSSRGSTTGPCSMQHAINKKQKNC
jgi:hypothetical protein